MKRDVMALPLVQNVSKLRELGWFSAGDAHFARFCVSGTDGLDSTQRELLELICASVSRALAQGHPCIPLTAVAGAVVLSDKDEEVARLPELVALKKAMKGAACLTQVASQSPAEKQGVLSSPLIVDAESRLYVTRYFDHEQRLADRLSALLMAPAEQDSHERECSSVTKEWTESRLSHYFPPTGESTPDLQRAAAAAALSHRFCVISGGPGTGKTSTVVKILALLAEQAQTEGRTLPLVQLMAPTGKAAARMVEAIHQGLEKLDLPSELREAVSGQASTIHRALGVLPQNSTRFARNAENRLRADVVLVDEASMVDLSLMRHLLDALRDDARLILLGDRHQLASVEAGSVLAELCEALRTGQARELVGSALVELKKSYRFQEGSGIAELAQAIRAGDGQACVAILNSEREDLTWGGALDAPGGGPEHSKRLREMVVASYGAALRLREAEHVLEAMNRFRILCAHRRGALGVEGMNELVRKWLTAAGLIPKDGEFYRGRLVLVTENDYGVGLRNGDIGLAWPSPEGRAQILFASDEGGLRFLSPAQLPAHETAFASTIHKSQGSEHDEVLVLLPSAQSPLLTRELVYTGVTRARKKAHLFGSEEALSVAAERSVTRHSGLGAACAARLGAAPSLVGTVKS